LLQDRKKGLDTMTTNKCQPNPDYEKYRGLRALLLTRVSTAGQSHDAQERVIREKLIEPLGLILDEENHVIHDTYTGLEYRYRAALDDILRMAERREFDLLCLDVLDRGLGRKGVSREIFRGQLRELGIHILTTEPSDHSDDDSLEGQLMRLLKGYKAEEEVNDFVRRSKNAIRHKALGDPEKGIPPKVVGKGIRTYGYKFVCDSRGKRESLALNYDVIWVDSKGIAWTEVRVVAFIFRCAKRRIGLRQICQRLNQIGIPAPSITIGRKYKSRGLQAEKVIWHAAVVSKMLRNPTYAGKVVVNGHNTFKVPGKKSPRRIKTPLEEQIIVPVPAVVSEEIQEEILKNLQRNQISSTRNNQGELTLLRAGYAKCGNCGRNLSARLVKRDSGYEYKYYRCSAEMNRASYKCIGCSIMNAKTVDDAAWQKAVEIIRSPSIVDAAIAERRAEDPTASRRKQINKKLASIKAERSELQANLLRMIKERALDRNTEGVLTNRLKELEQLEYQYNSELLDDSRIHQQWEATQRKLEMIHQKCAVMREKLNDSTYEPSYKEKQEMIEFFGIFATIWERGHRPRFKIGLKLPDIELPHRWI
jgi:site-specific DNA recombinase